MTSRRDVLALLGFAPWLAHAQQRRVYRVGVLETTSLRLNAEDFDRFRKGMEERGYVEGPSLVILYRSAEGNTERFDELAAELVKQKVDLILTRGTPATLAARRATATIPIVMAAVADPVESKLAGSLARPGGNVTGLTLEEERPLHRERQEQRRRQAAVGHVLAGGEQRLGLVDRLR